MQVANIKHLKASGIDPENVIYMSYEVDISVANADFYGGVTPNFIIFTADSLMSEIKNSAVVKLVKFPNLWTQMSVDLYLRERIVWTNIL